MAGSIRRGEFLDVDLVDEDRTWGWAGRFDIPTPDIEEFAMIGSLVGSASWTDSIEGSTVSVTIRLSCGERRQKQ